MKNKFLCPIIFSGTRADFIVFSILVLELIFLSNSLMGVPGVSSWEDQVCESNIPSI
jgi:hypothetical protein